MCAFLFPCREKSQKWKYKKEGEDKDELEPSRRVVDWARLWKVFKGKAFLSIAHSRTYPGLCWEKFAAGALLCGEFKLSESGKPDTHMLQTARSKKERAAVDAEERTRTRRCFASILSS